MLTWASGGTGIRARLKIVFLRECGFDSHLAHQVLFLIIILEYRVAFQFFDPSVWWRVRNPLAPKRTL